MSAFLLLTHISLLYIFRMMRQLNNIHFDTIQGASARQSKIVSSASQSPLVSQQKDEKMKKYHLQVKSPNTSADNFYGASSNVCGSATVLACPEHDFVKIKESRKCKKCSNILRVSKKGGK